MIIEKEFKNGQKYVLSFNKYENKMKGSKIPIFEMSFENKSHIINAQLDMLNYFKDTVIDFLNENRCLLLIYSSRSEVPKSLMKDSMSNQEYRSSIVENLLVRHQNELKQLGTSPTYKYTKVVINDDLFGDHYLMYIYSSIDEGEALEYCKIHK